MRGRECAVPEKNPYPAQGRSSEIPRGRGEGGAGGSFFAKILEAKYGAKLDFPRGRGGGGEKTKNLPWGEYGYFLELHYIKDGVY